jgi:hypothetical protein
LLKLALSTKHQNQIKSINRSVSGIIFIRYAQYRNIGKQNNDLKKEYRQYNDLKKEYRQYNDLKKEYRQNNDLKKDRQYNDLKKEYRQYNDQKKKVQTIQ